MGHQVASEQTNEVADTTVHGPLIQARTINELTVAGEPLSFAAKGELWKKRHEEYVAFMDDYGRLRAHLSHLSHQLYSHLRSANSDKEFKESENSSTYEFMRILERRIDRLSLVTTELEASYGVLDQARKVIGAIQRIPRKYEPDVDFYEYTDAAEGELHMLDYEFYVFRQEAARDLGVEIRQSTY